MPRKSRTPAAAATVGKVGQRTDRVQPPAAPTGMAYGAHAETVAAQRDVPIAGGPAPAAPPPAGGPGPSGGPPAGADRLAMALAAAQAMPSPEASLAAPTMRPGEPVTAGLPSGAGAGPEVLATSTPGIAQAFERIAYVTGDPDMAVLAQVARGYGV